MNITYRMKTLQNIISKHLAINPDIGMLGFLAQVTSPGPAQTFIETRGKFSSEKQLIST